MTGATTTATRHGLSVIPSETTLVDGPSLLFRSVNAYKLGMLSRPEPTCDLALLLDPNNGVDGESRPSFETVDACLAENRRRSSALVKAIDLRLPECSEWIDDLNERLDECTADNWCHSYIGPSRASAISMRELRLRLLGAILKFVSEDASAEPSWISISHPDWEFGLNDAYWDEEQFHVPRIFRSLLRIGGVMTASGYLITYLHTLFNPKHKDFRLQYRGICAGDKLGELRNLTKASADPTNTRLVEDYTGLHPKSTAESLKIGIREIKNLQLEIPSMMPQMPTVCPRQRADTSSRRTPEPHRSGYLRWAHLYRFEPIVEMSGVALRCPTANVMGALPLPTENGASLLPVLE